MITPVKGIAIVFSCFFNFRDRIYRGRTLQRCSIRYAVKHDVNEITGIVPSKEPGNGNTLTFPFA